MRSRLRRVVVGPFRPQVALHRDGVRRSDGTQLAPQSGLHF